MAMNEEFFIVPEDLYRLGNSESPKMTAFRPTELTTYQQNGVEMISANGRGISLYNKQGLEIAPLSGWVWQIERGFRLPDGLKLIEDGGDKQPGHFTLAPSYNMLMSRYVSLLEEVALYAQKVFKKTVAR